MSDDCLFCKMVSGEIPVEWVRDEETWAALRDINPQGPSHLLIIPKRHIASINDLTADDAELMGSMILGAKEIAAAEGVGESGYRLVYNVGRDGSQTVFHIHLHLIGGRQMTWPPG